MRPSEIESTATTWLIRLRDPNFADWPAFTVWMEADPRHNAAYEEALRLDAIASAVAPRIEPSVTNAPARR